MRNRTTLLILLALLAACFLHISTATAAPNNRTPDSIIIIWTDGSKLKAVNLTFLPDPQGPIGIISVPRYTWLASGQQSLTVEDYYQKYGRQKLIDRLEELFGTSIGAFIKIDQQALVNVSNVMGQIPMNGQQTTLLDVFEGKYTNKPVNLQEEIRQLAGAMITPAVIIKSPQILWIFCTEVESNIGSSHIMAYYKMIRSNGPGVLQKSDVPGNDLVVGNRKLRQVQPDTWSKTLKDVTS
ncbi:transcriptional attenuator, LytR family [Desulfotomaculum arcticum]|uniref:Transcriptional attenuator, LytR family n=1 Tax=Desulfotruncus arcticus DSM 17038 TaxID=1121424 RepID=A0A1I2US84_9FIRM|nr:hypothetical protein [Desulfotruncus arcticus]SFG77621.1 transcriptional attenuator, LytR family [Desulfotomaculum arcticum] [Desulfotruncus arcticus DSM 17038]